MSKAGDQMPDNNNPALRYNSFDDNKNTIQPFINWNGELKMVKKTFDYLLNRN